MRRRWPTDWRVRLRVRTMRRRSPGRPARPRRCGSLRPSRRPGRQVAGSPRPEYVGPEPFQPPAVPRPGCRPSPIHHDRPEPPPAIPREPCRQQIRPDLGPPRGPRPGRSDPQGWLDGWPDRGRNRPEAPNRRPPTLRGPSASQCTGRGERAGPGPPGLGQGSRRSPPRLATRRSGPRCPGCRTHIGSLRWHRTPRPTLCGPQGPDRRGW